MPQPQSFIWYELMTTDLDAAIDFYKAVIGWESEEFPGGDFRYVIMKPGEQGVAGIMTIPDEAARDGTPPMWTGYIYAPDVDAATQSVRKAGGAVYREPYDIPGVGRFAVVADPQGAAFMVMAPQGPEGEQPAPGTPGHVGWHELYTTEWQAAFDFYSSQFGWTKDQAMDMGEMGTYQVFAAGGAPIGGMMNKPPQIPVPMWMFYFNVADIDAAAVRVTENGGKVLFGPMEVPGGGRIVQATDPQGATFALFEPKR